MLSKVIDKKEIEYFFLFASLHSVFSQKMQVDM